MDLNRLDSGQLLDPSLGLVRVEANSEGDALLGTLAATPSVRIPVEVTMLYYCIAALFVVLVLVGNVNWTILLILTIVASGVSATNLTAKVQEERKRWSSACFHRIISGGGMLLHTVVSAAGILTFTDLLLLLWFAAHFLLGSYYFKFLNQKLFGSLLGIVGLVGMLCMSPYLSLCLLVLGGLVTGSTVQKYSGPLSSTTGYFEFPEDDRSNGDELV